MFPTKLLRIRTLIVRFAVGSDTRTCDGCTPNHSHVPLQRATAACLSGEKPLETEKNIHTEYRPINLDRLD